MEYLVPESTRTNHVSLNWKWYIYYFFVPVGISLIVFAISFIIAYWITAKEEPGNPVIFFIFLYSLIFCIPGLILFVIGNKMGKQFNFYPQKHRLVSIVFASLIGIVFIFHYVNSQSSFLFDFIILPILIVFVLYIIISLFYFYNKAKEFKNNQ